MNSNTSSKRKKTVIRFRQPTVHEGDPTNEAQELQIWRQENCRLGDREAADLEAEELQNRRQRRCRSGGRGAADQEAKGGSKSGGRRTADHWALEAATKGAQEAADQGDLGAADLEAAQHQGGSRRTACGGAGQQQAVEIRGALGGFIKALVGGPAGQPTGPTW